MKKRIYRKKITVAIDLLGSFTEDKPLDRENAVETLKNIYEKTRLTPFRGVAFPNDIYDKEMATIYVVGKYGMGIDTDFPDVFEKLFEKEKKYEDALQILLSETDFEDKRKSTLSLLDKTLDSNELARIFRLLFTKIILGFEVEDKMVRVLQEAAKTFPELEEDIKKYARFYIGFRLAEMIAVGEIKSSVDKEARKQAFNLMFGLGKVMPDDNYIYTIARNVFKAPRQKLTGILHPKRRRRKSDSNKNIGSN